MKLENQVCSLELAKKLKELDVKQESYFYHIIPVTGQGCLLSDRENAMYPVACGTPGVKIYSAFTVAELGEMLPVNALWQCYPFWEGKGKLWACEVQIEEEKKDHCIAHTEADARAKMLIHLIEKGIVKP